MANKRKSTAPLSEDMQQCQSVLKFFQARPEAEPFLQPVDWQALNLPDYPEIVKHPMDLGTVEANLNAGKYSSVDKFASDMRLVWKNAMTYNRQDSEIYSTAEGLSKLFEKRFIKIKPPTAGTPSSGSARKKQESKTESTEVSRQDRVKFSQLVHQLASDQLGHIVGVLQRQSPDALNEEDDDELEIEINKIDSNTLLELITYANSCIQSSNSTKKKKK